MRSLSQDGMMSGGGSRGGSQSAVFWPSHPHEARQTLGIFLLITLLMGVGVPVALFLAFEIFRWWLLILLTVVTVLPFIVSLLLLQNLRYEIGPAGITVYHFGAKVYSWDEIQAVEVWRKRIPSLYRVGIGSNLPGYNVGRFRSSQVGDVQVYATRLATPLVVLKTRSLPVVLSPEDVDGFMAVVQRLGGRVDIVEKK